MKAKHRAVRQQQIATTRPPGTKPTQEGAPAGVQREGLQAYQRVRQQPSLLTPSAIMALQRTIGNAAVNRLLGGQTPRPRAGHASPMPATVQRLRSYEKAPGSGGLGYKIVKQTNKHVKYHPVNDEKIFFNEFHVTFELFSVDTRCPKFYFTDEGVELTGHDDDRVNREYRNQYGQDAFNDLAKDALPIAKQFLNSCNTAGARFLNEAKAQEFLEDRAAELKRREKLKQEEDERAAKARAELEERRNKERAAMPVVITPVNPKQAAAEAALLAKGLQAHSDNTYLKSLLTSDKAKLNWPKDLAAHYDGLRGEYDKHLKGGSKEAEEEEAAKKKAEEIAAAKKLAEEEAAKKKAEEEAAAKKKAAEIAAAKKKAEELAAAKKKADEEAAAKKKAEELAAAKKKKAAEKKARQKAARELAAAKKAEELAAAKKAEELAAAKKKAEELAAAKKAEEAAAAKKKAEELAAAKKKAAEEEAAAKKKAEELAAIKKAEELAAAKKKAEEEEALAKKLAAEEAAAKKLAAEEEALKKKAAEEAALARKLAEEEAAAKKKAEEEEAAAKKLAEELAAAKKAEELAAARKKAEEEEAAAKEKAAAEEKAAKKKAEEEETAKLERELAAAMKMVEEMEEDAAAKQGPLLVGTAKSGPHKGRKRAHTI